MFQGRMSRHCYLLNTCATGLQTDILAVLDNNKRPSCDRKAAAGGLCPVYFLASTVTNVMSDMAVPSMLSPKVKVGGTLQMLRFLYLLGST